MPHSASDRPLLKVGVDVFYIESMNYILLIDYYSKLIEIMVLSGTTSAGVITNYNSIFPRYGNPDIVQ